MKEYRLRIYTGPTCVSRFASMMGRAGANDLIEGTEHVYASVIAESQDKAKRRCIGLMAGITMNDIYCIRENPVCLPEPAESNC